LKVERRKGACRPQRSRRARKEGDVMQRHEVMARRNNGFIYLLFRREEVNVKEEGRKASFV
jgi:hypothetical protein